LMSLTGSVGCWLFELVVCVVCLLRS
jgi:hypothetical protein